MSFHVFFSFSTGLAGPMQVPRGTKARIMAHVEEVERTLGLKRTKYEDNPVHWDSFDPAYREGFPDVADDLLCRTVQRHNRFVRRLYEDLATWGQTPPADSETLTEAEAAEFWHGLAELSVAQDRWTREYFVDRMEHLYDVMRGRESEGVSFDAKPLTPAQAAAVVRIFDRYLDKHDMRLDVPHACDHLASSYDGGYDWCGTCFRAMIFDDAIATCRRRKCELKRQAVA